MNMPGLNIFIMMQPENGEQERPAKTLLKKMLASKKKTDESMDESLSHIKRLMLRGTSAMGGG